MSKKFKMYQRIEKHGNDLNAIFNTGIDPIELCKKLRRLEKQATILTTDYCNTGNQHELELEKIQKKVNRLLKTDLVFINLDPRGYALKIQSEDAKDLNIYKDWGGYGIIAPDLTND